MVLNLPVLPPTPLGTRYQHEINATFLSRIVNAIVAQYDDLKFRSLSWGYWHALCATPHIAGVHFGAIIEALQRRYAERHPDAFETKLISDKAAWKTFSADANRLVASLDIRDDYKRALTANIGNLNRMPQRMLMDKLLKRINIRLGPDEDQAWKRRDAAAHGNEIEDGTELQVIRDNKLLKVLFHRILLRVTNASDTYHDYCSAGFPIRDLREPVPPA